MFGYTTIKKTDLQILQLSVKLATVAMVKQNQEIEKLRKQVEKLTPVRGENGRFIKKQS